MLASVCRNWSANFNLMDLRPMKVVSVHSGRVLSLLYCLQSKSPFLRKQKGLKKCSGCSVFRDVSTIWAQFNNLVVIPSQRRLSLSFSSCKVLCF